MTDSNEVVEVLSPPFLCSRFAYQEPLVKVEIFFFDNCHPIKEIFIGIPFEKAKYSFYSLATQREYLCALDRSIPIPTQIEYEEKYLSQLNGIHILETKKKDQNLSSFDAPLQTDDVDGSNRLILKKKKILTPKIQTLDPHFNGEKKISHKPQYLPLSYFRKEAKNIILSDLDSMIKLLFPAIFPLWDSSCKMDPFYYYSIAMDQKEFFDSWSVFKRKSVLFIWARNISLAAKIYWKLPSLIPISQILNWASISVKGLYSEVPSKVSSPASNEIVSVLSDNDNLSLLGGINMDYISSRNAWKDTILLLQGQRQLLDQVLYCRYCGRPFLISQLSATNLSSHYKRCILKPLRNDLSTILQIDARNTKLSFPKELWQDLEFRRYWLSIDRNIKQEYVNVEWIWENLPKKPLLVLPRFGLLNLKSFTPIGILIAKVYFYVLYN